MPKTKPWLVLKFGGTSVSSQSNWEQIAAVIEAKKQEGYAVCIVHSALKGVSNLLQQLIHETKAEQAAPIVEQIKEQHLALARELDLNGQKLLRGYFGELENISNGIVLIGDVGPRVEARLLALGELMATTLGSAYLNNRGCDTKWKDARELLQSVPQKNASQNRLILSATCDVEQDEAIQQSLAESGAVILTQGFIASDDEGKTVLLGRGGSDVSAAYFAAKLNAERLEIWTDVPGLFSANPNLIPSARLLKHLSYEEAQEIATNGAKVLHPRCIYPARRHNIPIHVRCTHRPELEGTIITDKVSDDEGAVKTVAVRQNITLVSMESLGMWQQVGFLADAFDVFKQYGLSIDLISTSESNITVSLDQSLNTHFNQVRNDFTEALSQYCKVEVIDSVSAVSLLGRHIRTILHRLGDAFEVFREHQIYLVSQAANDLNFTFVVAADQANRLLRQLHEQVITQTPTSYAFGRSWSELMEEKDRQELSITPWWHTKRDELLELAKREGSIYVYSAHEIQANINKIKQVEAVDRYFYAMKANANRGVLHEFYDSDMGFECVSIGEVERVLELFPDINRDRILFTPNFAPRKEYELGFEHGVHVTLDNIYPLRQWPSVFAGREIFLRIDPGQGQGHHKHVKTGGIHSKFGIPQFEISEVKNIVDKIGATVKGLHAHTGSGIKDESLWKETAVMLHEVAEKLGGVEVLDLGGGFGIQENETQGRLDLHRVDELLQEFKKAYPEYELWIEPGRFLTATAGVLLTPITQLKGKGNVRYIGVETGMNSLIRPALYGASHTIANLSKLEKPASQNVNIVGPICESGDKLGIDRRFPDSEEGDIICIANTGAYGHVMSSNYNLRAPAREIVLEGNKQA